MDLKKEIISILNETKEKIISNIDSQGIKASGRTQKSLKVEDRGEHLVLIQEATDKAAPFTTLQYGRPGGNVPRGFAAIIRQWIIDKGIQTQPIPYVRTPSERWQPKYTPEIRGQMAAAGAIAEKIAKIGTDRHKTPNENVYSAAINEAIEKIEKMFVQSIKSEIRR